MGWKPTPASDAEWKVAVYWNKQSQALEQDRAAGGRTHRILAIEGSQGALGRIILKRPHRRIYAELRWQVDNKELSQYLCEVSATSRKANLAHAWRHAHENGLTKTGAATAHTANPDTDFGAANAYSAS